MTEIMKIITAIVRCFAATLILYGLWSMVDLWFIPMKPFKSVGEEKFFQRIAKEEQRDGGINADRWTEREWKYARHLIEIGFIEIEEGVIESGGDDEGDDNGQQREKGR